MMQCYAANCSSDVLNEVLEDKLRCPRLWPTKCLGLILVVITFEKKQENGLYSSNPHTLDEFTCNICEPVSLSTN
jgi:hypothetical protein